MNEKVFIILFFVFVGVFTGAVVGMLASSTFELASMRH